MSWLGWAGLVLRATASGIAAVGKPKWNDTALVVRVWAQEPGTSAVIGEALVQKDRPLGWSGGENGFSAEIIHHRRYAEGDLLHIRVWSGEAYKSDVITEALAIRRGGGWEDRENGYSVHRTRIKS